MCWDWSDERPTGNTLSFNLGKGALAPGKGEEEEEGPPPMSGQCFHAYNFQIQTTPLHTGSRLGLSGAHLGSDGG